MSELHILYSVVLKSELPLLERELFRQYCHDLHGDDGSTLLQLRCTAIDFSHALYLELVVVLPRSHEQRRLRLPHAYVLIIEGDGAQPMTGLGYPVLPTH
jgi:hypothetical protein